MSALFDFKATPAHPRIGILNIQNLGSDAFSNLRRYRNCLYSSSNDEYLPLNFISGKREWGGNPPLERGAIQVVTPFKWGLLPHWLTRLHSVPDR